MENLRQQFYKKETNTDIYINWNSHARMQWKIDTLKNLVKRSIIICFDQDLLQKEVDYLRKVFVKINDYLTITLENIIENELQKENVNTTNNSQTNTTDNNETKLKLFLPFSGKQGIQLLSKWKKQLKKSIPSSVKTYITYERTKYSTKFPSKDRTKPKHKYNVLYFCRYPNVTCKEACVGETDGRINKPIIDHNKRDQNSHLLKHTRESQHTHAWKNDFKTFNGNYKSSIKRKISEMISIRTWKPTLNVKEKSTRLGLYNWFSCCNFNNQ